MADDTASWQKASFDDAASWAPVGGLKDGVGVWAYGYVDWAQSAPRYHVHTLR